MSNNNVILGHRWENTYDTSERQTTRRLTRCAFVVLLAPLVQVPHLYEKKSPEVLFALC